MDLSTMSFFADRKMMGMRRPSARMRVHKSNPFMPGSMTSKSSRSGFSVASISSPDSASVAPQYS